MLKIVKRLSVDEANYELKDYVAKAKKLAKNKKSASVASKRSVKDDVGSSSSMTSIRSAGGGHKLVNW